MTSQLKDIKAIAIDTAKYILTDIGYFSAGGVEPSPLQEIARFYAVRINSDEFLVKPPSRPYRGIDASLWKVDEGPDYKYYADIYSQGLRARFTIAHEIGHAVLDQRLTGLSTAWNPREKKLFLDEFASRILLPDALLRAALGNVENVELKIPKIDEISRRTQASMTCVIHRLGEACLEGIISLKNSAMMVVSGLSERKRSNYAPRVWVRCLPKEWYIPVNTRLMSLGMVSAPRLYHEATPFVKGVAEDRIKIRRRNDWNTFLFRIVFWYVIYKTSDTRLMLMVFDTAERE